MTKLRTIRTFFWGLMTGGLALTVAAFSSGWVVSTTVRDQQVKEAWVDGQASICASLVLAFRDLTGEGTDLSGDGVVSRIARDDLASAFSVTLPGETATDPSVIEACAELLVDRKS